MTTVIPFIPSNLRRPAFQVTLDGAPYNVQVTFNIAAQRFYINIYGMDGTWIVTTPIIASPPSREVVSAVWDVTRLQMTVTMVDPSQWPVPLSPQGTLMPVGEMVDYTMANFSPDTYNGLYRCLQVSPTVLTYSLTTDPGSLQVIGTVNRMLNMVKGLFTTSTLIFRNGAFEVSP